MVKYRKIDAIVSDKDKRAKNVSAETLGIMRGWSSLSIKLEFDMFHPCSDYDYTTRRPNAQKDKWPVTEPATAPKVAKQIDVLMDKMVKAKWVFAEPSAGALRGSASPGQNRANPPTIGTRGGPAPQGGGAGYNPAARPTPSIMGVQQADTKAIATDWWFSNFIQRTNAVTFRGDKRDPATLFENGGFKPPNSRTDASYQDNQIAESFTSYMLRRYGKQLSPEQTARFGAVLRGENVTDEEKELLYCYAMWKRLLDKEASHLGRMVDNEFMKGFISTSKSLDTAATFAAFKNTPGWVYVTVVHSGYMVPKSGVTTETWATQESEIAQFGPIPWARIVGFRKYDATPMPTSPIFLRRSFFAQEPEACACIYEFLSGKMPGQMATQ